MFVEDITALKLVQIELERYSKNLEKKVKERTLELEEKNIALESGNEELAKALNELKNFKKTIELIEPHVNIIKNKLFLQQIFKAYINL